MSDGLCGSCRHDGTSLSPFCEDPEWKASKCNQYEIHATRDEVYELRAEVERLRARLAQLDRTLTLDNGTVVRAGEVYVWDEEPLVAVLVTAVGVGAFLRRTVIDWPELYLNMEVAESDMACPLRPWSEVYPDRPVPGEE